MPVSDFLSTISNASGGIPNKTLQKCHWVLGVAYTKIISSTLGPQNHEKGKVLSKNPWFRNKSFPKNMCVTSHERIISNHFGPQVLRVKKTPHGQPPPRSSGHFGPWIFCLFPPFLKAKKVNQEGSSSFRALDFPFPLFLKAKMVNGQMVKKLHLLFFNLILFRSLTKPLVQELLG